MYIFLYNKFYLLYLFYEIYIQILILFYISFQWYFFDILDIESSSDEEYVPKKTQNKGKKKASEYM